MKLKRSIVILDLETTGTWVEKDKIVEIGMVKIMPDGAREEYVKRVNPGMHIPEAVSKITGIVDSDVENAPFFKEIAPEVVSFMAEADLGGFGIERFDLPLLERELIEAGFKFSRTNRVVFDAQKIYHMHEKRTLTAAYQFYCDKELREAHSALGDAKATKEILEAQIKKYGSDEEGMESLKAFDYERSSEYYDKERKFRWWNGQVYPVFGKYGRKKSLEELAKKDPSYLDWILKEDFSEEVKKFIRDLLEKRKGSSEYE